MAEVACVSRGLVCLGCWLMTWILLTCLLLATFKTCWAGVLTDEADYNFQEEIENELACSEPVNISNGETIVWGDGLLLEYRCKYGYYAVGVTHGGCDPVTGSWTIDPPLCVDKGCPELSAPSNGVINLDSSGGLAHIVCRHGYFLLGDSTLVCEDGQWRGVFPICAVTPQKTDRTKSRLETEVAQGGRWFTADNSLSESDESCFYNQVQPPEIKHAVVETKYVFNDARRRYVMVAFYSCMGHFQLRNSSVHQLFCKNLLWSAPVWPECILEDDPCEVDNGGCQHYCTPTGSNAHACSCYDGFTLSSDAKSCVDADECAINNGRCEQKCHNTEGSFACFCETGFLRDGLRCLDIDECAGSENQCPGACINLPGSFRCDCRIDGFVETDSMHHCKDVDECATRNGGCEGVCQNIIGSFQCRCETKGKTLGNDKRSCVDVDECVRYKPKICANGQCQNTEGSFRCVCGPGYQQSKNMTACQDINECAINNGGCAQVCQNTQGSYRCLCQPGYQIGEDKVSCRDINECLTKKSGCQDSCVNTLGSFRCTCTQVGHVLSSDGLSCSSCTSRQFFNRSTLTCVDCPRHAHARDGLAVTLQDCRCDPGFHGNPGLEVGCQDTNECHSGELKCAHQCVNTLGSAHCACPPGQLLDTDGLTCRDINECKESRDNCSQICDNTPGSYLCRCLSGFRLQADGFSCSDVDECETGLALCSNGCLNSEGGFTCLCGKGYQLSSNLMDCEDVDECQLDSPPCDHTCTNTPGSFTCSCRGAGFKLSRDLTSCLDVNECMEGDNPCPDICVNTPGSYMCDCDRAGYRLLPDSSSCVDIDECSETADLCVYKCLNTPGSYKCVCPAGYQDTDQDLPFACKICEFGTYRGLEDRTCRPCPARTNTSQTGSGSIRDCVCLTGYQQDPGQPPGVCVDVNECQQQLLQCEHQCVNTLGSAHCLCHPGFSLAANNVSFHDINECASRKGGCDHQCVNTPGSYLCQCPRGLKLSDDGHFCEDQNQCEPTLHGCEHRCLNTRGGGATCTCPAGYQLLPDGKKCTDVDECRSRKGGCTDTCINTPGSYRCECNVPGYKLSQDDRQCVDINECQELPDLCQDVCINLAGSFKCHCHKQGYTLAPDRRHCEDVDECAKGQICQHRCLNVPGSFRCDCDPGYYQQGNKCRACLKGTYRGTRDPLVSCLPCPAGMTTSNSSTESIKGCFCPPGYQGRPARHEACQDVDECQVNNGGCQHTCLNSPGSFTCACRPGFNLSQDAKTCHPTQCPLLDTPDHARLTTADCRVMDQSQPVVPGTVCSYKCHGALHLKGSQSRTCLANFTWTGTPPSCAGAFSCDRLPVPANGFLHPAVCMLPSVPFKTRCQFRCKKGYTLIGRAAYKCRPFNRWSGNLPPKCLLRKTLINE